MTHPRKCPSLAAVLAVALVACVCASSALAGGKVGLSVIWDPVSHAPTTGDVIHVRNFRRVEQLTGGFVGTTDTYGGQGVLMNRCGSGDGQHWCKMEVSYELTPGVKPFTEIEGDSRVHDLQFDRGGFARDSSGGYAKAGTSFEFSRLLTGEAYGI